jgi:hypothetical protein
MLTSDTALVLAIFKDEASADAAVASLTGSGVSLPRGLNSAGSTVDGPGCPAPVHTLMVAEGLIGDKVSPTDTYPSGTHPAHRMLNLSPIWPAERDASACELVFSPLGECWDAVGYGGAAGTRPPRQLPLGGILVW